MKHVLYLVCLISPASFAMHKPCAPASNESRLLTLKTEFLQHAGENRVNRMKDIEKEAIDSHVIAHQDQKAEKLDYFAALAHAVHHRATEASTYLLNKKNLTLKGAHQDLLFTVCQGNWAVSWSWYGGGETNQKNIAQLMIKKGAPSTVKDLENLIRVARSTKAPERLITYLEEVHMTRLNS